MPYTSEYYRACGYVTECDTVTDRLLDIETIARILNLSANRRINIYGHGKYRIINLHIDADNTENSHVVIGCASTINVKFTDIIDADRINRSFLGSVNRRYPHAKDFNTSSCYYGARIAEMIHYILKKDSESSRQISRDTT